MCHGQFRVFLILYPIFLTGSSLSGIVFVFETRTNGFFFIASCRFNSSFRFLNSCIRSLIDFPSSWVVGPEAKDSRVNIELERRTNSLRCAVSAPSSERGFVARSERRDVADRVPLRVFESGGPRQKVLALCTLADSCDPCLLFVRIVRVRFAKFIDTWSLPSLARTR